MSRPHHHRRPSSTVVALAGTVGIALAGLASATAPSAVQAAGSGTVVVHPDESIQAALDDAQPNSTILVVGGVHAEQLTVTKDGITLIGVRTRLVPPATAVTNLCSGLAGTIDENGPPTQAGICVHGDGVELAPFKAEHRRVTSVARQVRSVTVAGFQIEGFSGANVAVLGAADARLARNTLVDGGKYGAVTAGSTRTRVTGNTVSTSGALHDIGLCADDVSPATVDHNDVSGYVVGLCVQTQGADFRDNIVHDNCIGVYVDPGIGAVVRNNHITANNGPCEEFFVNGIGVYLDSTQGTQVTGNRIDGHTPAGYGAGLVITDGASAAPASDNTVRNNSFADNTLDILFDTAGSGNTIRNNRCTSSHPAELCS
jgi:hypothetical protein